MFYGIGICYILGSDTLKKEYCPMVYEYICFILGFNTLKKELLVGSEYVAELMDTSILGSFFSFLFIFRVNFVNHSVKFALVVLPG